METMRGSGGDPVRRACYNNSHAVDVPDSFSNVQFYYSGQWTDSGGQVLCSKHLL